MDTAAVMAVSIISIRCIDTRPGSIDSGIALRDRAAVMTPGPPFLCLVRVPTWQRSRKCPLFQKVNTRSQPSLVVLIFLKNSTTSIYYYIITIIEYITTAVICITIL